MKNFLTLIMLFMISMVSLNVNASPPVSNLGINEVAIVVCDNVVIADNQLIVELQTYDIVGKNILQLNNSLELFSNSVNKYFLTTEKMKLFQIFPLLCYTNKSFDDNKRIKKKQAHAKYKELKHYSMLGYSLWT